MKVDVTLSVNDIKQEEICNKTVIVIDSLRATSTILTALYYGCKKVIPVETVGQALQYADQEDTILIGERYGKKVIGFDLGNSPLEVSKEVLQGKTVVITSTNGTKALQKAKKASTVLVGSILNATHCMEQALKLKKDIMIICAGRRGRFAIEDGLTAGMMIHHARRKFKNIECSDIALMLENSYDCKQLELSTLVMEGATGRTLIETLQEDDIYYCLQKDKYSISGILQNDSIIILLDENQHIDAQV